MISGAFLAQDDNQKSYQAFQYLNTQYQLTSLGTSIETTGNVYIEWFTGMYEERLYVYTVKIPRTGHITIAPVLESLRQLPMDIRNRLLEVCRSFGLTERQWSFLNAAFNQALQADIAENHARLAWQDLR